MKKNTNIKKGSSFANYSTFKVKGADEYYKMIMSLDFDSRYYHFESDKDGHEKLIIEKNCFDSLPLEQKHTFDNIIIWIDQYIQTQLWSLPEEAKEAIRFKIIEECLSKRPIIRFRYSKKSTEGPGRLVSFLNVMIHNRKADYFDKPSLHYYPSAEFINSLTDDEKKELLLKDKKGKYYLKRQFIEFPEYIASNEQTTEDSIINAEDALDIIKAICKIKEGPWWINIAYLTSVLNNYGSMSSKKNLTSPYNYYSYANMRTKDVIKCLTTGFAKEMSLDYSKLNAILNELSINDKQMRSPFIIYADSTIDSAFARFRKHVKNSIKI